MIQTNAEDRMVAVVKGGRHDRFQVRRDSQNHHGSGREKEAWKGMSDKEE
jgi:hypothetical protein